MTGSIDKDMIERIAEQLDDAERTGSQIGLLSLAHPAMTIDDGYAVQQAWVARKIARGNPTIGHKIGLTSRAMQRAAAISEPDYGVLLEDMLFHTGATLSMETLIVPRVEVELAFILKDDLSGPHCSLFDVLRATEYVTPALEIIDARVMRADPATGTTRKVVDTISDNAANAAIVLGGNPVKPDAVDLRWVSALIHRNGGIEDSGVAAAVLNHPGNGVAWLANKLATRGVSLKKGQIVLGGSFTAPIDARAGDGFHVDYGPMGSIAVQFA